MSTLLFIARLSLAGVFLISAGSKILDLPGFRQALSDFGVPRFVVGSVALALPLVELGIAAGLVMTPTAWFAAVAALGLLLIFMTTIAVNMARGRTPNCHCFGQLYSKPIGWPTLARNLLLAAISGVVVWHRQTDLGGSAVGWLTLLTMGERVILTGVLAGLLLLGLVTRLLLQMLAQQGRVLLRLDSIESKLSINGSFSASEGHPVDPPVVDGLPVGQRAPEFRLPDLSGEMVTLDSLLARGKPALLAFTDPGCGHCKALLPDIGRWQQEGAASITLAVVSRGSVEANRPEAAEHNLTDVLLQVDREVAEAYKINATPGMVLVRPDGIIGSPAALGQRAIMQMINQLGAIPSTIRPPAFPPAKHSQNNGNSSDLAPVRPGLVIGDQAPPLKLPNIEGAVVSLESYLGSETLVLFWNPHCGFCNHMLRELKAWEANIPTGAPKLLVVSTGSVEDNRAEGLSSPVVLDSSFSARAAFGVNGTPSAVLVDSEGKIASEVAVGAYAVLKLTHGGSAA